MAEVVSVLSQTGSKHAGAVQTLPATVMHINSHLKHLATGSLLKEDK